MHVLVGSSFWLLQILLSWTFMHKSSCGHIVSFLWPVSRVGTAESMVSVCLILFKNTKLFSKVVTFHVSISSLYQLWLLYIFDKIVYVQSCLNFKHSVGYIIVSPYFNLNFLYNYLFRCLFAFYVSSLVK